MERGRSSIARVVVVLAAWTLAACTSPRTEIVLRVTTDMDQGPGNTLQAVTVQVTTAGNVRRPLQTFQLLGTGTQPYLPADLGIVPNGSDASRSVTVDVTALGANATVLFTYHVIAPFTRGQTTRLDVFLAARCLDANARAQCTATQTCGANGCDDVVRTSLPTFLPDAAYDSNGLDGTGLDVQTDGDATIDADAHIDPCVGGTICNGQCALLQTDIHHCGACDLDCTQLAGVDQGSASCVAGACQFLCLSQYADCDPARPGCETNVHSALNCGACGAACASDMICDNSGTTWRCALDCTAPTTACQGSCTDMMGDPMNCGACGNACPGMPNGSATCVGGHCGIMCSPGFHTCGGTCSPDTSVNSCGNSCAPCPPRSRATPTCTAGACGFTCLAGYADCDTLAATGCESARASDPMNCGTCGTVCPASAANCVAGVCTSSCVPGGTCARPNPCAIGMNTCVAGVLTCSTSGLVPAGTACGGGVCDSSGTCNPCVVGQACSTGNDCEYGAQVCATGTPHCGFDSDRAMGSSCNGGAGVCNGSGGCVACVAGAPCMTGNTCILGTTSCSSGMPMCVPSGNAMSGTPCGGSPATGTCDGSGHCNVCTASTCPFSNPCYTGIISCPAGTCSQNTARRAGAPCPGGVCDGSGFCNACTAGTGCAISECESGQTGCSTGHPVCTHAAYQPAGTACMSNTGVCDGMGNCGMCAAGAACTLSDCNQGVIVCTSGHPVCTHSTYVAMGTSCNLGTGVCDGAGMCTLCTAGMACTLSACDQGTIACGSGAPVCTHSAFSPAGTTCNGGAGVCTGTSATCSPCTAGMTCAVNECDQGAIACGSGRPVCTHTMFRPLGTSCASGTGSCDGNGNCGTLCTAGAACTPTNPCDVGAMQCPGAVCMDTGTAAPSGATCPGGSCNGSGLCVPLDAGGTQDACVPDDVTTCGDP